MKIKIAEVIKHLRKVEGLTLKEASEKIGLQGKSSFQAYEEGRAYPKLENLVPLAVMLQTNTHTLLFGWCECKPPDPSTCFCSQKVCRRCGLDLHKPEVRKARKRITTVEIVELKSAKEEDK